MRSLVRAHRAAIRVEKRRKPGDPAHRRIGDDLLASEKRLADIIETAAASIPSNVLTDAVTTGDITTADDAIRRAYTAITRHVERELFDQFVTSGRVAALELADQLRQQYERVAKADAPTPAQVAASFRFGEYDPRGLDWIRRESSDLVTNMVRSDQLVVRQLVEQAYDRNQGLRSSIRPIFDQLRTVTPSAGAQSFASTVGANLNGLTVRYEQAVMRRVGSLAADLQARGITGQKAVDQLRREADKYSDKLRRARAQTIARTERMRAHNEARLLSFNQAIDSGLVRADLARKVWQTGVFDVCPVCVPMQGQERLVNAPFTLPSGRAVMTPPGHPNCRCTMQMRTNTALTEPAQISGSNTMLDPMSLRPGGMSSQAQQFADLDFPDPSSLVDDILDDLDSVVDTSRARRRVRYAADDADIVEAAREVAVHPDEMLKAVQQVPDYRRAIRDRAAVEQQRVAQQFERWGVTRMQTPPKTTTAEYDWFVGLSRKEQQRLRGTWMNRDAFSPDELVAIIRSDEVLGGGSYDEIIDAWLDATRRYDAYGAMRRGKMPTLSRYSDDIDVNRLLPDFFDEGLRVETILTASDDLTVAKHIVRAQRDTLSDEAWRQLGTQVVAPSNGTPAFRMSFQSWEQEVRELEQLMRDAALARTPVDARVLARHAELVPRTLDIGQDFEDLYALIVDTARLAGLDVSDTAIIPWRVTTGSIDVEYFDELVRAAEDMFNQIDEAADLFDPVIAETFRRSGSRNVVDSVTVPAAQRGVLAQRAQTVQSTLAAIDRVHGLTDSHVTGTAVRFGGAADKKGGHFTPRTRGVRPRRTRGMTSAEWNAKAAEYNAREVTPEILLTTTSKQVDEILGQQANDLLHEFGHLFDWDSTIGQFRSAQAWRSSEAKALFTKYRANWVDHIDEIVDPEINAFMRLAAIMRRDGSSTLRYFNETKANTAYREYFLDVVEAWARAYNQWIAEQIGVAESAQMLRRISSGFQFNETEMVEVRKIVEEILRLRGVLE